MPQYEVTNFADVNAQISVYNGHYTYFNETGGYILAFKEHGLIDGYSDNLFHGERLVTREQAAKILVNILNHKNILNTDINYTNTFPDVYEHDEFYESISILNTIQVEGEKIISGYSNNKFKPKEFITKEQMTKITDLAKKY